MSESMPETTTGAAPESARQAAPDTGPGTTTAAGTGTAAGDYAATFQLLDVDGDGRISAAELKAFMLAFGEDIPDAAAVQAVQVIDADGDGLISLDELAGYLSSRAPAGG